MLNVKKYNSVVPELIVKARNLKDYPQPDKKKYQIMDFVFLGYSNVGKSSLINCLSNNKRLAVSSTKPGRTRSIDFYQFDKYFFFVDMPGYGYAYVSDNVQDKWFINMEKYFFIRPQERYIHVLLLIDARRGLREEDIGKIEMLFLAKINFHLILTKIDKIKKSEEKQTVAQILQTLIQINNKIQQNINNVNLADRTKVKTLSKCEANNNQGHSKAITEGQQSNQTIIDDSQSKNNISADKIITTSVAKKQGLSRLKTTIIQIYNQNLLYVDD